MKYLLLSQIQFKKTPIAQDVSVEELVTRTHGYSGAEVNFFISFHRSI